MKMKMKITYQEKDSKETKEIMISIIAMFDNYQKKQ